MNTRSPAILLIMILIGCFCLLGFDRYVEVQEKQKKAEQVDRMLDMGEDAVQMIKNRPLAKFGQRRQERSEHRLFGR